MFRLLEFWGVRPDFVMGHSVGELTAAHVAGSLCLQDAAMLVAARGRLMQALPAGGAMVAVQASEDEVRPMLGHDVSIAAVNGPASVVISGARDTVNGIAGRLRERGRRIHALAVSHAFHSPLMEPMIAEFRAVAAEVTAGRPSIGVISNVTGQLVADDFASTDYWAGHIRAAVRFADSVRYANCAGANRFIEVGPSGGLTSLIEETLADAQIALVPTLRKDRPEPASVTAAAAHAFVWGAGLDWVAVFAGLNAKRVELPTYAFQHQKFWLAPARPVSDLAAEQTPAENESPLAVEDPGSTTHMRTGTAALVHSAFADRLAGLSADQRLAVTIQMVCEHTAAVLGRGDAADVDSVEAFTDAGLNSLSAVELRNRLKAVTGATLPTTAVFDHPTPTELARHLLSHLDGTARPAPAVAERGRVSTGEPIAVVGMGCRYPGGVVSAADLWELVASGRDAIGEFPTDRGWDIETLFDPDPDAVGKCYTRHGGFIRDAAMFDAEFFGISRAEALAMDPQQRLLLETSWQALETAGIDPLSLRGSATGVFIGIYGDGYGVGTAQAQWYADTGHITSVASGRIAYKLGLAGPALSVDTACSSSLVALHLAAQSLRAGECDLALAGGSTVLATPSVFIGFSRQRGLSRDGRCKAFADAADGTGFSEGVGVLVLQRLGDACRLGRPVLAVLAGSAVNQDGASNGLTAPSGPAQQRVITAALADAGITGADVDVVEAHGTGTRLGDPIEAEALLATYGRAHTPDAPLWLGSIKSNIGHSQAAAGVAGVIKMIEAMRHQVLPATLHVDRPSSHVDWSSGTVRLLTEARAWPAVSGRPRRAGVSSFGVSGTNAHVIVEQVDLVGGDAVSGEEDGGGVGLVGGGADGGVVPWVISGKTASALAAQAGRLERYVRARPELDAVDVGYSLVTTRSVFDHRAVVVGDGRDELLAGLVGVADGRPDAAVICGGAVPTGKTVVVFPGQGAQWLGMGGQLYARYPVFAQAFDAVVDELDRHLRCRLREVMWGDDEHLLNTTEFAQPSLFAVEVALFRLLEFWGVRPDFVMGHSVGELTAAHVAGSLCLQDAAMLVAARGRLMQALPAGGAMVAVQASEDEVRPMLGHDVSIAAVNGPASVVISGARDTVNGIAGRLRERGRRIHALAVSHAFHSPLMEPMIAEFRAVAAEVTAGRPSIGVISNVTGQLVADDFASTDYWAGHIRAAVRFADSVRYANCAGANRFIEVGPSGGLTSLIEETLADAQIALVPTLRKDRPEPASVTAAAAHAFVWGAGLDWVAVFAGLNAKRVELPTYAFQHQKFWLAPARPVSDLAAEQTPAENESPLAVEDPGSTTHMRTGTAALVHSAFADRLAGLSADQRLAVTIQMVCEHTAAVLGRGDAADVDSVEAFTDAGLNSLSAVELRNRLKAVTGATLPTTAVFDHPTPTELARHLLSHLDGTARPAPAVAEQPEGGIDALADLFLQTCDSGFDEDGWRIVALASKMRERMTIPVRNNDLKDVSCLADGSSNVIVVCIPTLTVLSDIHEYRDLANALAGSHSIYSLPLPGFDPDDALPRDADVVLESLSRSILDGLGNSEHLVLAGYSSGGVLAYALSCHLAEKYQRRPLGVALIDTYLPSQLAGTTVDRGFGINETGRYLSRKVIQVARTLNQVNTTRLTAAAAYASIFRAWKPSAAAVPVLNIVAKDGIGDFQSVGAERVNSWPTVADTVSHTLVEVAGDHFEMITTSRESTAAVIRGWISGLNRRVRQTGAAAGDPAQ